MSEQQDSGRGAAEENTGVPETEEEQSAAPAGADDDVTADGAAEENAGVDDAG
jgi:hypothetical protein